MKQNPKKIKYPIGVQSFRKIREENYFLSRPRRFGKSLLLSTLEAYYRGHRDLFNGLALESLTDDWDPHPVLHLDLNNARYDSVENLNNLRDISFENQFDSICGITHEELTDYFKEGICQFTSEYNISEDEVVRRLEQHYDGYHFSKRGIDIFNPFSLVNAFAKLDMGSYWFERGTPGYLVKLIRKLNRLFKDIAPVEVDANYLESAGVMSSDPVPAFYQSGYMTIKDYSPQTRTYILDYPNEEVKEGFLKYLFQMYVPEMIPGSGFSIPDFMGFVRKGNADGFMKSLASLIAGVPYSEKGSAEAHFQNAIYLLFTLLGYFTFIEQRTSNGRIDLIVETSEYIYLFEFKVDSSSDSEIKQMEEKQYWLPYLTSQKEIILIGANFNTSSRTLDSYIISKVERH